MPSFELVGHRGAAGDEPENTLRSFKTAIAMGADWIELDVRRSKDGVIVVMHDETVDRTTDGTGEVASLTLAEMKKLDAGKGETIPRLQEVIDLAKRKVKLDIEIKAHGIEKDVVDIIERNKLKDCMVSSFKPEILKKVRSRASRIMTGIIVDRLPEEIEKYLIEVKSYTDVLLISKRSATPEILNFARDIGMKTAIWNADTPEDIKKCLDMRPDLLCTNFPDRVKSFLVRA